MKVLKKTTFSITLRDEYERQLLVLADSMEEAIAICREYFKNSKIKILKVSHHMDVLTPMSKTVTIEL